METTQTVLKVDHTITEKDKNIVRLLASGMSVNDIRKSEKMDVRKLQYRIDQLKIVTNCRNVVALVAYFIRNKLIE